MYHPLGALLFANETYYNTIPLVNAAGLPLAPGISAVNGWRSSDYGPGKQAIDVVPAPPPSEAEQSLLEKEYAQYVAQWTAEFEPQYTALRYTVRSGARMVYTE